MMPLRRALVDSAAIAANVAHLRTLAPAVHTMVVVKADGYGHGAVRASHAALDGGATWLGVADISEALELRAGGITAPVLAWLHAPDEDFRAACAAHITIGVSRIEQLEALAAIGGATVHLKVDTGLGRNGVGSHERDALFARAAQLHHSRVITLEGVMSHVAGTSRASDMAQGDDFLVALGQLRAHGVEPELQHMTASAASIQHESLRGTMVRFGIAAYGIAPSPELTEIGVRPAMRLETEIALTKRLRAGDGVSYDHTWQAETDTTVALVPLGYADGVPRQSSGQGWGEISGIRYPVVGRVAMDQIVVNVGDDDIRVGDRVALWGDPRDGTPSATEWAAWSDTIGYDMVTGLGRRVARLEWSR